MKYDNYGNIVSKNGKEYLYDTTWRDLLKSYDGYDIEYDAQGNPVKYLDHTLTWEKGRQLKSFDSNTYTYNANGIRTSKTINGVKHDYTLDGTKILCETWGTNTLIPIYDSEDSVCGIIYNGTPHYFLKNLQGDILAIVDKDAQTVARYSYDAWGVPEIKLDSSTCQIATINPFRYRGYYYDEDLGMYYLQTRYYDAEICRFINADGYVSTGQGLLGYNMYAYCGNNPVNFVDYTGEWAISVGIGFFGVVIGGVSYGLSIAFDDNGNLGMQLSEANVFKKQSGAVIGGIDLGINVKVGTSVDADVIYDLENETFSVSGSIGNFGAELSTSDLNDLGGGVNAISFSYGASIMPADLSITSSKTTTLW